MPVRSLTSSVLRWPGRQTVDQAFRVWAVKQAKNHPELLRLGYFGSYARGDWGVGSDLDILAVVRESPERFDRRSLSWELTDLPVPAEIVVYTGEEWANLMKENGLFGNTVMNETVWIIRNDSPASPSDPAAAIPPAGERSFAPFPSGQKRRGFRGSLEGG
ncbi:MAG: nucleotidyltransferase domain-containing protein [Deltaproteobacteria bacterium]|nr:nucleotidyltransferase domain-containing protein [Deltaproteobacteria bacterium]